MAERGQKPLTLTAKYANLIKVKECYANNYCVDRRSFACGVYDHSTHMAAHLSQVYVSAFSPEAGFGLASKRARKAFKRKEFIQVMAYPITFSFI